MRTTSHHHCPCIVALEEIRLRQKCIGWPGHRVECNGALALLDRRINAADVEQEFRVPEMYVDQLWRQRQRMLQVALCIDRV